MFKITHEVIKAEDVIRAVEVENAGAIVPFLGIVRNNTGGRKVAYLEYEAYAPMAETQFWTRMISWSDAPGASLSIRNR